VFATMLPAMSPLIRITFDAAVFSSVRSSTEILFYGLYGVLEMYHLRGPGLRIALADCGSKLFKSVRLPVIEPLNMMKVDAKIRNR